MPIFKSKPPKAPQSGDAKPPAAGPAPSYQVLSSPWAISDTTGRKVLVGGRAVFASLDTAPPSHEFIRLPDRGIAGGLAGLRSALATHQQRLQVYVHPALVERRRARYALTIDCYLRWGLRHGKGTVALIGGVESESDVALEILIFRERCLVQLTERELPAPSALSFRGTLETVLDELHTRYPGLRVVIAAPLSNYDVPGAEYIGQAALAGARFAPLVPAGGAAASLRGPLLLCGLGVAAYAGAVGTGWTLHQAALAKYDAAARDPVLTEAVAQRAVNLEVLEQRRLFMEARRRQELLMEHGTAIATGVGSVPGVRILELRLPAPSLNVAPTLGVAVPPPPADGTPDVTMRLSVPRQDMPALDQAKAVLHDVSVATGMNLYLTHNGWSETETTRTFTVEGNIR